VAFSTNSFAALVGIPIASALLGTGNTNHLHWTNAIIFSAVGSFLIMVAGAMLNNFVFQVFVFAGAACFAAAAWHAANRRQ
jgi:hypothetical protein